MRRYAATILLCALALALAWTTVEPVWTTVAQARSYAVEGEGRQDTAFGATVIFADSRPPLTLQAYRRAGACYLSDIGLSAALGISVKWDPLFRILTLAGRKGEATAVVGGTAAVVDGDAVNLPDPFLEEPGRLMIPISFLTLKLPSITGLSVSWDEERATLSASAQEPSVLGVTFGGRPGLARVTVATRRPLAYRVLDSEGGLGIAVKGAVPDSSFAVQGSAMNPVTGHEALWSGDELILKLGLGGDALSFQTFREEYPQAIVVLVSDAAQREGFDLEPLAGTYRRWANVRTVVLDPAHGGDDWGARGAGGLKEKDVVLEICLKAASIIRDRLDLEVYLTRDSDYRVPAAGRAETANSRGADVFVSVHCDSWPGGGRSGYGACVLPPAMKEGGYRSREPARPGGIGESGPGSMPAFRPWSRAQGRYVSESRRLAEAVLKEMGVVHEAPSQGVRELDLVSLVGVDAPAVSVQCGFLDSSRDLEVLSDPDGRDRLAAALARGIEAYINER